MTDQPIIHMVGSMPLADADAVFRTLGENLGVHLQTIPDGETGRRSRWISFINDELKVHSALEIDPDLPPFQFSQWDGKVVFEIERLRFKDGVDPSTVEFVTGYADDAIANYDSFVAARKAGSVPSGVKYQICMATPLAIAYNFISINAYDAFIPAYTRHLHGEFKRIIDTIPHEDIAYQWDVCQEVLMWENYFDQPDDHQGQILTSLSEIGSWVPESIDLGYHLCYGSPADEHMVLPKDMTVLVDMANGILDNAKRPLKYIHMPVLKDRNDDDYFRPLTGLRLPEGTVLYLGLVHEGDGPNNAAKLATARKYAEVSGISAECGLGRGKPDQIESVLAEHRRLAEAG